MNKIILILFLNIFVFADFRVINEYKVNYDDMKPSHPYKIQTVCKDGYQYTIVLTTTASIVQDFKKLDNYPDFIPIQCDKK